MHELGTIHPIDDEDRGTRFEVKPDMAGVMCKGSCKDDLVMEQLVEQILSAPPIVEVNLRGTTLLNTMDFSDANEERILKLDSDHKMTKIMRLET